MAATDAQTDRLVAYLRGVIDASENTLRFLGRLPGAAAQRLPSRTPAARALDVPTDFTWALAAIGVPSSSLTGQGVSVAVLDTGVDLTHPDLVQHFPTAAGTAVFVPDVDSVQDGHGHGTHCAGVIAGAAVPQSGPRYAVAPDVTLLVGKVLDDQGSGFDDGIIEGIEWASQMGAGIISMSLGSARSPGTPYSPLYERVGSTLLAQGTLLVAAAGNESHRPSEVAPIDNPAVCPSFMAIGAVDSSLAVGWFSCGNVDGVKDVDIVAPGVAIQSAWTGGGYQLESGTSMATPHVAAAAALWAQSAQLSGAALRDQLKSAARALGSTSDFGAGLVQVPVS
jgi:subtilisin family serine protease